MKTSTKTTHRFDLDEHEQFDWVRTSNPYKGHAFKVETVELEFRDGVAVDVYLRGPWVDPCPVIEAGSAGERGGWETMFVDFDQPTIWLLPAFVLDALLGVGLEIARGEA
jgi:hypothetical protein